MRVRATVAAAMAASGLVFSAPAHADDLGAPPAPPGAATTTAVPVNVEPASVQAAPVLWGDRMLAGHTFLFPNLHAGAFNATYFGITQGLYQEHIPDVPVPIGGTTNLDVIGYSSAANLGIKICDWFGVQATGVGRAVVGMNGNSVIYAGGNLNAGGFIAPIFRLARIESTGTQVSARAEIGWTTGAALDIPRFLLVSQNAIAGASGAADAATTIGQGILGGGLGRTILAGTDQFGLNGSIEAAQALGPMFGLQAGLTFERRVLGATFNDPMSGSFRDSVTRYDLLANFSAEWDGDSVKVPIAAILEYQLNARLGGSGDQLLDMDFGSVSTFGLGVYYSGRKDLQVGIFGSIALNLRPIPGAAGAPGYSGTPDLTMGQFVIRYVW